MPPLKALCLHGAGTSAKILQVQLGAIMRDLENDHSASFQFLEGEVVSAPGPNIAGFFEGPYYSYYNWPRSWDDDGSSMIEAYEQLLDIIETEGPFDAVIGFSHGGTLACGFIANWTKQYPYEDPPFRCAIFFNSLPPFALGISGEPVFETGLKGRINIPTLHVVGSKDFIYEHSLKLHQICDERSAMLIVHERGHTIPTEPKVVKRVTAAMRDLSHRIMFMS